MKSVYEIGLFWELFNSHKYLMLFIFNDFIVLNFNKFKKLPDNVPFMALGEEWVKRNNKIIKL